MYLLICAIRDTYGIAYALVLDSILCLFACLRGVKGEGVVGAVCLSGAHSRCG